MCIITGIICIFIVGSVLITVNKRIPASFLINILLSSLGILSRALNELLDKVYPKKIQLITTSTCVALIEMSLAYFVYEIWAFKVRLTSESPAALQKAMEKGKIIKWSIFCILAISSITKIYTEQALFSQEDNSDEINILPYLATKIIFSSLLTMRIIALTFCHYILGENVWYFVKTKNNLMKARG